MELTKVRDAILDVISRDDALTRKYDTIIDPVQKIKVGDLIEHHDLLWFTEENGVIKVHVDIPLVRQLSNYNEGLFLSLITGALELIQK